MKRVLAGFGLCLLLIFLINLGAGLLSSDAWAFDAARAELNRRGLQDAPLLEINSNLTRGLFGSAAVVTVEVKEGNDTRTVRIFLRKHVHLLGWQVTDYQEE